MASAGTAYVDIEAKLDGLSADVDAAVANLSPQVEVGAQVDEAQAEIDSLNADPIAVDVGAQVDEAQGEIDSLNADPITVNVDANTDEAQSKIDGLGSSMSQIFGGNGDGGEAVGGLDAFAGAALGAGSAASIAASGGIAALALGLGTSLDLAMNHESVYAQLDQILETTGASAYTSGDNIAQLAGEIQNYSGISDEAIAQSSTLLLTFAGVSNEAAISAGIFDRATRATADMAVLMGGDASQAALRLGRALDNPAIGLSMLQRSGVSFTESQKALIQSLWEAGDAVGAQSALLDAVEGQLGGVAEAYGETLAGQIDIVKQKTGDLAEVLGGELMGSLEGATQGFGEYVDMLTAAEAAVGDWGGRFVDELQSIGFEATKSIPIIGPVISGFEALGTAMNIAGGEAEGVGRVVGELPGTLQRTADTTRAAADAADQYAASLITLDARTQTYLDGVYRVPEAERGLRDALEATRDVLADPDSSYDDVSESLQNVAVATGALSAATGDAAGAVATAKLGILGLGDGAAGSEGQVGDLISTLDAMPGQVDTTVGVPGAVQARSQAEAVGDALLGIPPTTTAYVGVSVNRAGFDQLVRDLEASERRRFQMQVSVNQTPARASGGPVSRGESYLVGEEGPEMFVPRTSGTILSAPVTAGLGGNTYNVTVNAHGGNADDIARVVTDELRRLERAGR